MRQIRFETNYSRQNDNLDFSKLSALRSATSLDKLDHPTLGSAKGVVDNLAS